MAAPDILQKEKDFLLYASVFEGDAVNSSRGSLIEKKIEILEGLTSSVSNRRTRRLLNDRLLMELVPVLNAEEVRGLFAPPPWGEEGPLSAFYMANVGGLDKFRNTDMDKEANFMKSIRQSTQWKKNHVDGDRLALLNAWHRIDRRTREALKRSSLSELIEGYEKCIRSFIQEGSKSDVLELEVQDPFHRLLLHGVCEFYSLVSVTETQTRGSGMVKTTKIKKKKAASSELPSLTLSQFLKVSKQGMWIS